MMKQLFLCLILVLAGILPAKAQGIAVIVNGQVVSEYDVAQRQRLLGLSNQGHMPARNVAVEELIDERIKLQEAAKLKFDVKDDQVDRAFSTIAQRSNASGADFAKLLQS